MSREQKLSMRGKMQVDIVHCLQDYLKNAPSGDVIRNIMGDDRVFEDIAIIGEPISRRTLTMMEASEFMSLATKMNVADGGFPEVITELANDNGEMVLRVVGMKNMDTVRHFNSHDELPVVLSFHGPQSLPGTGIFALMRDGDLPSRIVSNDGLVSVGTRSVAVTSDSINLSPDLIHNTAAAMEGLISVGTCTPVHEQYADSPVTQAAIKWACRQEDNGVPASAMSDYERMVKATQIVDRFQRQALEQQAKDVHQSAAPTFDS